MNKSLILSVFVILLNLFFWSIPQLSYASEIDSPWATTTSLPYLLASHGMFIVSNKLFIIGGSAETGHSKYGPISASVNIDGTIKSWNDEKNQITVPLIDHSVVTHQNFLYVLGGVNENDLPKSFVNSVFLSKLNSSEIVGTWDSTNKLPIQSGLAATVVLNDKIYFAGGTNNNAVFNQIYSAPINSDGTVGNWTLVGTLPKALSGFGMVANGNSLVVIGGEDSDNQDQSGVYTALVNADGSIGSWKTTSILPQPVYRSSIVKVGNKVVSIGGIDNGITLEEVYYADLNSDGTIGTWQTSQNFLPQPICCGAAATTDNFIYLTGGYSSDSGYLNTVYYTKINMANDLAVPLIKQTSNPWQSQEYDSAHIWNPSDITINTWGCALTSATMIFRYYGINELPDGTTIDPGSLNTWLKSQPDGYVGTGWVNWLALSRLSKIAAGINHIVSFDALEYTRIAGANTNQLTKDLSKGNPDILEEPGHFIVAKGTNGTTFDINDPYNDRSTLNDGYNNNFLSLGQYTPSHTDLSYLMFTTDPNTTITVKNKNGTIVGTSFVQSPIINPQNASNKNTPIKIYYFQKPDTGAYTVTISGGNTALQTTAYFYDQQGNPNEQTLKEFNNTTFYFSYDKSNNANISLQKSVTFDSAIQDGKTADKLHTINSALAASLITILQTAKAQSSKHADIAKTLLTGGIKLLHDSKNFPFLISPDTYTILNEDFIDLRNSL